MTSCVPQLPKVTAAEHQQIVKAPRTSEAHRALMAEIPAMSMLETAGVATGKLNAPIAVAAWNAERCIFPNESAAFLARYGPQVVLLSEMDIGMG